MMDMISDAMPMILNGVGGAVLGPVFAKLAGSRGSFGGIIGIIAGVLGGAGLGTGAEMVNFELADFMGGGSMMRVIADLAEGGIGGAILGIFSGRLTK
jgi:hypothetical protein